MVHSRRLRRTINTTHRLIAGSMLQYNANSIVRFATILSFSALTLLWSGDGKRIQPIVNIAPAIAKRSSLRDLCGPSLT